MTDTTNDTKTPAASELMAIADLVPRLFFKLRILSESLHRDDDLSTPERGVLIDIAIHGPLTSPQIAALRPVTRQAIQPVLTKLLERGYVEIIPNPRHRRSPLHKLTATGERLLTRLRQREVEFTAAMYEDGVGVRPEFALARLSEVHETLAAYDQLLSRSIEETDK